MTRELRGRVHFVAALSSLESAKRTSDRDQAAHLIRSVRTFIAWAIDACYEELDELEAKRAELAAALEELEATRRERDAAREQLQTIGRKAFWASKQ